MNILFICKYNRFRSKVAEALFNYYNKDENIKVKSAGIVKGTSDLFSKPAKDILIKRGIKIEKEKSQLINSDLINWADKIIIVADNVPKDLFPKEKTIVFPIPDAKEEDLPRVKDRMNKIEFLIKDLIKTIY